MKKETTGGRCHPWVLLSRLTLLDLYEADDDRNRQESDTYQYGDEAETCAETDCPTDHSARASQSHEAEDLASERPVDPSAAVSA
jgi:hypothetical protein